MRVEEIRQYLVSNQGKPGPKPVIQRFMPNLIPAALSAVWIGIVIARPLVLLLAVWLLADGHSTGFVFAILWLAVLAYLQVCNRWTAQVGFHASAPLTAFQHSVSLRLSKLVNYEAPVWYDCGYFCTVIPFFAYQTDAPAYQRYWLVSDDGQPLYIDWLLPAGEVASVCLCLHGVNGDSDANYVKDFAIRMAARGVAVGCMVHRGMGDSITSGPPSSWFSSARTCDIRAMVEDTLKMVNSKVPINLVGFSNGGTMLASYLGKMGESLKGKIHACFCISSTLRAETAILRPSCRVWHYPVCFLLMKKFVPRIFAGVGIPVPKEWRSISTVMDLDQRTILPYQGYKSLDEYYRAISAWSSGGWRNISVPMLMLHARDDPVLHVDDTAIPDVYEGNSFISFLITGTGGHVGWPSPRSIRARWQYVADVACEFFAAVDSSS